MRKIYFTCYTLMHINVYVIFNKLMAKTLSHFQSLTSATTSIPLSLVSHIKVLFSVPLLILHPPPSFIHSSYCTSLPCLSPSLFLSHIHTQTLCAVSFNLCVVVLHRVHGATLWRHCAALHIISDI